MALGWLRVDVRRAVTGNCTRLAVGGPPAPCFDMTRVFVYDGATESSLYTTVPPSRLHNGPSYIPGMHLLEFRGK